MASFVAGLGALPAISGGAATGGTGFLGPLFGGLGAGLGSLFSSGEAEFEQPPQQRFTAQQFLDRLNLGLEILPGRDLQRLKKLQKDARIETNRLTRLLNKPKALARKGLTADEAQVRIDELAPQRDAVRIAQLSLAGTGGATPFGGQLSAPLIPQLGGLPQQQVGPAPPEAPDRVRSITSTAGHLSQQPPQTGLTFPQQGPGDARIQASPEPQQQLPQQGADLGALINQAFQQQFHPQAFAQQQIAGLLPGQQQQLAALQNPAQFQLPANQAEIDARQRASTEPQGGATPSAPIGPVLPSGNFLSSTPTLPTPREVADQRRPTLTERGGVLGDIEGIDPFAGPSRNTEDTFNRLLSGQPSERVDLSPEITERFFNQSLVAPALRTFDEEIKPRLADAFAASGNTFSTRRAEAEQQSLDELMQNTTAQLAQATLENQQLEASLNANLSNAAQQRSLGATGLGFQQQFAPLQQIQGLTQTLLPFQALQQDAVNRNIAEFNRLAPENDPYLRLALQFQGLAPPQLVTTDPSGVPSLFGAGLGAALGQGLSGPNAIGSTGLAGFLSNMFR